MEIINGYSIINEFYAYSNTQGIAKKDGREYIYKKYIHFVLPTDNGIFDQKTFEVKKEKFFAFVDFRQRIINTLKPVENYVYIPCDSFVYGIYYYEFYEKTTEIIIGDAIRPYFKTLQLYEKLYSLRILAAALAMIHSRGFVHSNICFDSIVAIKDKYGFISLKYTEFDSSFFADSKMFVYGQKEFASPELMDVVAFEGDDRNEFLDKLTEKTDIFSLGVLFYNILADSPLLPDHYTPFMEKTKAYAEKRGIAPVIAPHIILSEGCEFVISDRVQSDDMRKLLSEMLDKNPEKRPSAKEVLTRLNDLEFSH